MEHECSLEIIQSSHNKKRKHIDNFRRKVHHYGFKRRKQTTDTQYIRAAKFSF